MSAPGIPRSGPRARRPDLWARANALHEQGFTYAQLGELFGRAPSTVSNWVRELRFRLWEADCAVARARGQPIPPHPFRQRSD